MIEHLNTINLFYPLLFIFAIIVTFVITRVYNDKLSFKKDIHFKDKDVEITSEAFKRIGEVKNGSSNEIILNLQNKENNKEIFNHDKQIEELQAQVEFLLNENGNLRKDYKLLLSRFEHLVKAVGREI